MEMGGVEKVMLNVMEGLDKDIFEVDVILSLNQGELRNDFPKHVGKYYLAEGREDMSSQSILQKAQLLKRRRALNKWLRNPSKIDKELLQKEYDIEVAMTYNDFDLVLNSSNPNSKKVGWFHSEIDIPGLQPLVPGILEAFPQFDTMVYCSQRIQELMHQNYPELQYPNEKVIVNSIPIEDIKIKSKEETNDFPAYNAPTFISVGRLHYRKGYHKLIEAHKRLIEEGFQHQIIIIGEGEQRSLLEEKITDYDLKDSFKLLGNKMNPYPYIAQSDFFILPSESEAWPLVVAEALVLQKPTIATAVGDIPEMIKNEETGLLISYSVEEMYLSMKKILTHPNLVSEIKNNLKNIENQFDNNAINAQIEDLFLKLATQ